jgi:hypothetical protein
MNRTKKYNQGYVNGVKYQINDAKTVNIFMPDEYFGDISEFRERCRCVVRYLIDEGIYPHKDCQITIIK